MGILFALVAMLSWGVGDFLIQKSVRRSGTISKKLIAFFSFKKEDQDVTWIVLFYICGFGALVLTPFIWGEIGQLGWSNFGLLFLIGLLTLVAALFDFKALKVGKLSVVEPIFAAEIPAVLILTSLFLSEGVVVKQYILILVLVLGIFLVSVRDLPWKKLFILERGVGLAVMATIGMGLIDFLLGLGARAASPLMANWFLNVVVALVTFVYLSAKGETKKVWHYAVENKQLIFFTCFFDNLAWVAYAYSMILMPIAIATAISENYIAFGVFLGFVYNKERLTVYQWLGLGLAFVSWTMLALSAS